MVKQPTWEYEELYWQQGISLIAGIDEAGMGALAGPVVAAAVLFKQQDQNFQFSSANFQIRDSKTLSAKQREKAAEWIQEHAEASAVAQASVEEISALNIRNAAHLAMRRAIEVLGSVPDLVLIDGTPAQPHASIPAVNIIDGDALCISIAAASILAKVHRDSLMQKLDAEFPAYGFAGHKGYGSASHLAALREHGPCPHHRPTYAPIAALLTKNK